MDEDHISVLFDFLTNIRRYDPVSKQIITVERDTDLSRSIRRGGSEEEEGLEVKDRFYDNQYTILFFKCKEQILFVKKVSEQRYNNQKIPMYFVKKSRARLKDCLNICAVMHGPENHRSSVLLKE